jgi:hypothetical protein
MSAWTFAEFEVVENKQYLREIEPLKILVSVVQIRPRAPLFPKGLSRDAGAFLLPSRFPQLK